MTVKKPLRAIRRRPKITGWNFSRKVDPTRGVSEKTRGENISPIKSYSVQAIAKLGGFGVVTYVGRDTAVRQCCAVIR